MRFIRMKPAKKDFIYIWFDFQFAQLKWEKNALKIIKSALYSDEDCNNFSSSEDVVQDKLRPGSCNAFIVLLSFKWKISRTLLSI